MTQPSLPDDDAPAEPPGDSPPALAGVWIGVSIQSVTVTALGSNAIFTGTFFTPAMDARCVFSGRWAVEGDVLTLEFTECRPPVFAVPLTDRNRVEHLSPDSIVLHTLPAGPVVTWNRVDFAERRCTGPTPAVPVPPAPETLALLTAADLADANPLFAWIADLVTTAPGRSFAERLDTALRTRIPRKAGYAFAIFQVEGLWGNGGMGHVVLRDTAAETRHLLGVAAAGYAHFGRPRLAQLLRDVAARTARWMRLVEELGHRQAAEVEFAALDAELSGYDAAFAKLLDEEAGVYEAIAADTRERPHDYVRGGSVGG